MDNKFLKTYRLLTKDDFSNLRAGSRLLVSGIILAYLKENPHNHSRLGIAVSKKIGNAVKRNKIKRIIREFYRCSDLKNKNLDILITLNFRKIGQENLDYAQVLGELNSSLNELRV